MLSIKFIKDQDKKIKADLKKRFQEDKSKLVDEIIVAYDKWLPLKKDVEALRHKRNVLSQEVNQLKKAGKDASSKLKEVKAIPGKIAALEVKQKNLQEQMDNNLLQIPNIMHPKVPTGKDETKNKVLRKWGVIKKVDFKLVNHGELVENLGLADFDAARKNSGHGFNYLFGDLALLDFALQKYGLDFLLKKGFTPVIPPMLLRHKTLLSVLNGLEDFKDVVYKIEDEDAFLIGTAEHPLASLFANKTLSLEQLPLKLCAVTPCFRKEIGSTGVDTKGLFRMHQFNKVEQVIFSSAEDSFKHLEEMQLITEKFFQSLKIPYRVVEICSGDLGAKFARQYDIEAWFPRQKAYREVTSAGNCTDFQARALNTKYLDKKNEKQFVHILNNTMVATSRAMVVILETYQQKDGSIKVPTVLQKYMGGLKKIGKR
tara:strand:+ start:1975 stop:3258 length:1284 start_codon:yes stop_codon:yes gene_type:complete